VGQSVKSAFKKINGKRTKGRSLQHSLLRQALHCRLLGQLMAWRRHLMRWPLQQAPRPRHHP
jgi:hypothetical protein